MTKNILVNSLKKEDLNKYYSFIESRNNSGGFGTEDYKSLISNYREITPNIHVISDENGEIVGNVVCKPIQVFINGKKVNGYKYFDYFVKEEYRKSSAGLSLLRTGLKKSSPCFAINVSDRTKKICSLLKILPIGHLYKHLWLKSYSSVWQILKFSLTKGKIIKKCKDKELTAPEFIYFKNNAFRLLKNIDEIAHLSLTNYSSKGLEFKRTLTDIAFQLKGKNYMFYYLMNSDPLIYFSLRRISYKGLDLFDILDFRTPVENNEYFQLILKSVKRLAKINNLDGALCWNSHLNLRNCLAKNGFYKIGKPIHILTSAKILTNSLSPVFATSYDNENSFI